MTPQPEDLLLVQESRFLDGSWYLGRYPDVAMLGMHPAEHYLRFGAAMGRSPGPAFDGEGYLAMYPDVERAGMNPLLHYLRYGREEGRLPGSLRVAASDAVQRLAELAALRAEKTPLRHLASLGKTTQARFMGYVRALHAARPAVDSTLASIVMPIHNRRASALAAIASVAEQSHQHWELLIVDDGSTDGTAAAIQPLLRDSRIRLIRQEHRGVSAARNAALAKARGEVVFYLDSDNRWRPHYVRSMLTYLHATGSRCGYSALANEDENGRISSYRGEPFAWHHCLHGNYVDLNVFCHRAELYRELGGFDESLRRMVDWDLVLRYTRDNHPAFAPFLGCYYANRHTDESRISVSQPYAFRAIVQTKNRLGTRDATAIAKGLRLAFAIKIAAPYENRHEWGDYHYAESLAESLRKLGHSVSIDFRNQWYDRHPHRDHVVIVLRGLIGYKPHPEHVNVLWNISHPDQVDYSEYDAFDITYVASESYPELLKYILQKPARPLLQCTDPERFRFSRAPDSGDQPLLFVGNSRNHFRPVVRWATELNVPLRVYGTRWRQFIDVRLIAGEGLPNTELAPHYGSARAVLNDHWGSMRDFGLVSNRVFDVLASGGTLVSDAMPSITRLFGGAVLQVDSARSLSDTLAGLDGAPASLATAESVSLRVGREHSFEQRVRVIHDDVLQALGLPAVFERNRAPDAPGRGGGARKPGRPRKRVGLLLQHRAHGPSSSAFIRLIAPLTTDLAYGTVDLIMLDDVEDKRLDDCDACIVQRVAVEDMAAALLLVDRVRTSGGRLFVDNDDGFGALPETHPERVFYLQRDTVLRFLMSQAEQVWLSTEHLRDLYRADTARPVVVPNNLDPRLWRDYRRPARTILEDGPMQLLYMGTATHDADFALILPALDALEARRPGSFRLTNIAAVRRPPKRSWLRNLPPPRDALSYPHFVRWLSRQGPFDVGLAPLVDDDFNACKSDIKVLDYSALGLVTLVSDVAGYRCNSETDPLFVRAANTTEDWLGILEDMLDAPQRYRRIAAAAEEHVWTRRTATRTAQQLLSALD